MCQLWIDEHGARHEVAVVRPGQVPDGWREVLDAEDGDGRPVVLAHSSVPALIRMAVFDGIINNADRKGGHILTDESGRVWGIDHGVSFAVEDKLRTVLWGWAGEQVPARRDARRRTPARRARATDSTPSTDGSTTRSARRCVTGSARSCGRPSSPSRPVAGRPSRGRCSDSRSAAGLPPAARG